MTVYRCRSAWIDDAISSPVDIHCSAGLITAIEPAGSGPADESLPGLVFPGFADAHSHVFHRGLRGRTHDRGGTFWTWRDTMYALASRLDPGTFRELAVAAYAEMVCAGITAVGEFHYLHHGPGGMPYDDPNVMGLAAVDAGTEAGLAVTLLDTAYLAGGFDEPVGTVQQRFSDGSADAWAARVGELPVGIRVGVAIHSVRAVPPAELPTIVAAATDRVLHVHLSEQPAENQACLAATGRTPTALLADAGALGPRTAAVHATHLTTADVASARGRCDDGGGVPDHRGRPRRRAAGSRCARGRGCPAGAGRRSACDHRSAGTGPRSGVRRTAGHRTPGNLPAGRPAVAPRPLHRIWRSARRRASSRSARRPTWWPCARTRRGPLVPTRPSW